jgi:hypothetical protein
VCARIGDVSQPRLPDQLADAAARWLQAGRPSQRGSRWSLTSWQQWFPEQGDFFASVPNPIDRAAVRELCQGASSSPAGAYRGFVAAMIWGYGSVGYGAFRTARVLGENDDAAGTLMQVADQVRRHGGPVAFEWLADRRLRWLGVAFATKYLFFCSPAGTDMPALVFDQLVRNWLAEHAQLSLRLDWRVADYRAYVDTACAWAAELDVEPADVELLMFALADASRQGSQWAQPELLGGPRPPHPDAEEVEPGVQDVLEALDDAEVAFAALAGTTGTEDAEDFARGVRQLRRIVVSRRPE